MKALLSFFILLFLPFSYVLAQAGANDPSFNTFDDNRFGTGGGFNSSPIWCSALQPDQKILVGGNFTAYNGTSRTRIARLNPDGSLDTTFNPGTGFDYTVSTLSIQADGKIIVGGDFTSFNGIPRIRMARLNSDGSLDHSFNSGSYFNNNVSTTAIQADGKIIVGGLFTFSFGNGSGATRLVRLNTDGTPDATFHHPGAGSEVSSVSIQSDGKIIVAGRFTLISGNNPQSRIMRLDTDGHIDNTFAIGSGFNHDIYTTTLQSDGKILVAGIFTAYNGTSINRIIRLNTNGSIDTTFTPGAGFSAGPWSISMQSDEKIIVGGNFTAFNGNPVNELVRLNSNGTLDATFNPVNLPTTGSTFTTLVQADGKIIFRGSIRLNTDGSRDTTFNPSPGANNWIYTTAIQPDQKILAGGRFKAFNGKERQRITRLHPDGSLDLSFNPGAGFNGDVLAIAVQPDGKILAGGIFTSFNGVAKSYLVRLNPDGTLDATFMSTGTGVNDAVNCITIQPDGKIIIGGKFTAVNGVARGRIARLNENGTLDLTFNPGPAGFNAYNEAVNSISLQADGKLIVGGDFTKFNSATINRILRLNANGTLDPSFVTGTGFNDDIFSTAIQSDGKILIGGMFTTYNGTATARSISRLNMDGSIDNSFTAGTGFGTNTIVYSFALQSDEKIIAGGWFDTYNGVARGGITRLNTDGNLDTLFQPGTGYYANSAVRSVTIQGDGRIISGGDFTSFNGIRRNRIGRVLITCPTILPSAVVTPVSCSGASDGAIHLNPSGGTSPYSINWNDGITSKDRTGLTGGTYSAVITDANGCSTIFTTTITVPASSITATAAITNVSCFNGSNGEIDVTASGGTLPYTFDWGGGITTEDRTALAAGTYDVAIGDVNGCILVHVTITQPASALSGTVSPTNVNCFGGSDGAIDLTPMGGTAPYTVEWNDGITSEDRSGLTSGTYSVTISDHKGCVKTLSASVTQPAPIASSFPAAACYTYSWNGQAYTSSGSYTHVYQVTNGCDSTVTLNLTIKQATTGSMTQTACNSFTLNGQSYTTSGTYTQNLVNAAGCDSTLTLTLTITHSTSHSVTETACGSFTLNGETYAASGVYLQHLENAAGCDSALTLNLTILEHTTHSITETACDAFTLNGQTYTSSGTYTQYLENAAGCDSTLILHLIVSDLPGMTAVNNGDGTITASNAVSYQWIDCETEAIIPGASEQTFVAAFNGSYAVIGTSTDGCSSTSDCITINYLGLTEQGIPDISLSPNPTTDFITVQFEGVTATLIVRDAQGKILASQKISSGAQISMKNYADGVYLFEFSTAKGSAIKRVVKN
ncbi:hypothetical protein D3C87_370760 [compost metagenome]